MKDDALDLKRIQEDIAVSVIEIAHAADLHPQTVYKVLGNGGASRNSISRVRKALSELRGMRIDRARSAG